jgi:hypothetical protein
MDGKNIMLFYMNVRIVLAELDIFPRGKSAFITLTDFHFSYGPSFYLPWHFGRGARRGAVAATTTNSTVSATTTTTAAA